MLRSIICIVLLLFGCAAHTPQAPAPKPAPVVSDVPLDRVAQREVYSIKWRRLFDEAAIAHIELSKHYQAVPEHSLAEAGECRTEFRQLGEWQQQLQNVRRRIVFSAANAGLALNRAALGRRDAHEDVAVSLYARDVELLGQAIRYVDAYEVAFQACLLVQPGTDGPAPIPVEDKDPEPVMGGGPRRQACFRKAFSFGGFSLYVVSG